MVLSCQIVILTLKKICLLFSSAKMFKKPPIGAVCSESTLFASILNSPVMLGNYLQQTTFSDAFFFLAL